MDYILSYAETGDKPYIYLASLCDKYREFDPKTIASITKGVVEISSSVIRNGVFQMSDEDYYRTAKTLDFIEGLYGSIKSIPGQTAVAVTCIAWAINNTGASKDRIYRAITDNAPLFKPLVRTGYALFLEDLSFYYNKNLKTKESKISFDSLWKLKSLREG